ncbi:MAG: alanine--tRNA ligase [Candidatus Niyogibacteria bacterium]|nr:alanine--tRNA ligase [Candidatus Niyogibacteria bacterium]
MKADELRLKFLEFFKNRGHAVVPSSPLVPDDPSVLLTTAGMQQFKPYYTGDADPMKDFGAKNTASVQKCFRASDIDEVGDASHLTFFEMLGNFSFGGYFKEDAIRWAHQFVTKELGLKIDYVTVFGGTDTAGQAIPSDTESERLWKEMDPALDVHVRGMDENFWGPTGKEGPCGPTTEIYVGGVEIWNIVFNEFFYHGTREELLAGAAGKTLKPLKTPGVDTGAGFERIAVAVQKKEHVFQTDLFASVTALLPRDLEERARRIIADHLRASAFLLADGVRPSNKEAGYVLRRILRRALAFEHMHEMPAGIFEDILTAVIRQYGGFYPELERERDAMLDAYRVERERFAHTLSAGIKELNRQGGTIDAKGGFHLYESYGLPYEVIREVGGERARGLTRDAFDAEFKKHQDKSREGAEKKFGGHGLILDTGELKAATEEEVKKVTRLHTATHLLQSALRKILDPDVRQMGSDITYMRTRFDFSFARKLTPEELKRVEDEVNDIIRADHPVTMKEMDYEDAVASGALYFFREKYPKRVKVYTVGTDDVFFSREFCGGPHVSRTGEIGEFRIKKEEAVASGVRRIRAVVEP